MYKYKLWDIWIYRIVAPLAFMQWSKFLLHSDVFGYCLCDIIRCELQMQ